ADRRRGFGRDVRARAGRVHQHRRNVARGRQLDAAAQRVDDAVTQRRHVGGALFEHEAIQTTHDRPGGLAIGGARARTVARAAAGNARTAWRSWPMTAAARTPWPATSPIATPYRPPVSGTTSYQSPPTSTLPPGRYRAHKLKPGISGSASGSMLRCNVSAMRR